MAQTPDVTVRMDTENVSLEEGSRLSLLVINHERRSNIGILKSLEPGAREIGRESGFLGPGVLGDVRVSRRQARLTLNGRRVLLEDLGSANGTTVDGRDIRGQGAVELAVGQIVAMGDIFLMLVDAPKGYDPPLHPRLIGVSAAMARVIRDIDQVAPHDTTVLIQAETGCGKELVAKELHACSKRRGQLVPVHCGGISDELLLSELFGHVRGAFTGADRDRPGLVASAENGTLFLDEIGEAKPTFQVSLLRLLQENEYRPVGASANRKANVRVVAATHRDLNTMVDAGTFREDLVARLARWVIEIPPLRERREDIPLLAFHLANRHAKRPVTLHRSLISELLRHRWSKNVRELDSWMERAVVDSNGESVLKVQPWMSIETEDPRKTKAPETRRKAPGARPTREELVASICEHGGNIRAMSEALGVSRNTLYRWFNDLEIDPDSVRRSL